MQNSLIETRNVNASLGQIEQMKTFYPTEEEFSNGPGNYIEDIIDNKKAWEYDTVLILSLSHAQHGAGIRYCCHFFYVWCIRWRGNTTLS